MQNYKELKVWRNAHSLTLDVYKATQSFPGEEKFGMISQLRRASSSIPANIAEGFKKKGPANKARIFNIAQGSLEELRYYIILSTFFPRTWVI